ncbi:MAG: hypothetical protein ACTSPL_04040 [Candidatus Odinarchaeia archaeon]
MRMTRRIKRNIKKEKVQVLIAVAFIVWCLTFASLLIADPIFLAIINSGAVLSTIIAIWALLGFGIEEDRRRRR